MSDFFEGFPPRGGPGRRGGAPPGSEQDAGRPGPWGTRRAPRAFAKFEDFEGPGWGGPGGHMHGHGHGGPPWRAGRRMRRGDIRLAILVELLDGPAHGYELIGRLESRTGGMWRPSAGSVYPTLQMLEDEGLVAGRDENGKRIFDLTEAGRTEANAARERIGQAGPWAGAAGGAGGGHFELRKGMKGLVLAVRQAAVAGDESQVRAAAAVINEARQRIYRILAGDTTDTGGGEPGGRTTA